MRTLEVCLLLSILLIVIVTVLEVCLPDDVQEGFTSLITPSSSILAIPPRGDIGYSAEQDGYVRDDRYFHGYADVSRTGFQHDYCRFISPKEDPDNAFFACALAGTENLDSTTFRSKTTKKGLKLGRDDYMISASSKTNGRAAYCRILKHTDGSWQPLCIQANDRGFDMNDFVDTSPPEQIKMLLSFYQGCVMWLRFYDDMLDFAKQSVVLLNGTPLLDEDPKKQFTEGIRFNGVDQFLRLSDSNELQLGDKVPLRSIRAFHVWAYFDEFTNNAHIFDFGNGPGRDNVFLGIVGRGDGDLQSADVRSTLLCGKDETSTLPTTPSGAQPVPETTPQNLLKTTKANVDIFNCPGFEVMPRDLPHSTLPEPTPSNSKPTKATLLFEIWDTKSRKLQVKLPGVIPLKKWTHIVITAASSDSLRPDLEIYVNSVLVAQKPSGYLPSTNFMTNCYLAKSNWSDATVQYESKDELFRGALFDFRMYRTPLSASVIQSSYKWGLEKLGISYR